MQIRNSPELRISLNVLASAATENVANSQASKSIRQKRNTHEILVFLEKSNPGSLLALNDDGYFRESRQDITYGATKGPSILDGKAVIAIAAQNARLAWAVLK
jgi:hypothetical protein